MGKIRVHELAKKLNLTNQELMNKLAAKGVEARTHSSSIDEAQVMQALQSSGDTNTQGRPRTMLRRRRPDEEMAVVEEAAAPLAEAAKELEPMPMEIPAAKEHKETMAKAEDEQSEQVAPTPVGPIAPAQDVVPAQAAAAPAKSHHNVVRVIDANAIRARLASEGRSFQGRSGQGRPGQSGRPMSSPSTAPRIREVRIGVETFSPSVTAAPMGDAAGGQKHGARSSSKKKTGRDDHPGNKDRREVKGGGFDLWLTPGRKKKSAKRGVTTQVTQSAAHKRVIELDGPIFVSELAHRMSVKASQVVAKLMGMGVMATVNQSIDPDTAAIIASEFEYEVKNVTFAETDLLKVKADVTERLVVRAPVVTVMGHVDHGKTSLLDALRKAHVAEGEAGGITQHIGAYSVDTDYGRFTILDTPGHEAFTAMRARGAQVTDIVILVVAANDGVMPQTIEAIHHAKAANVPVLVAINKIDVPDSKPERVIQQLAEHGLVSEEWGGDVQMFKVSAIRQTGLNELLAGLQTQAEMMELKADPAKHAEGFVIEAKLDKGRGPVATVIVKGGTLKAGDVMVAGEHSGRVRAMYDSSGGQLEEAGPSVAVQVIGLSGVPVAGDKFNVVEDDKTAKAIASHRGQKIREMELVASSRVTLETFLKSSPTDKVQSLRLIVKADVYGSVEALVSSLRGLSTAEVKVEIVHSGVGAITENDINLAMASKAIIIGFNSKAEGKVQLLAQHEKVDIRYYDIIYKMLDEVRLAMAGLLAPILEESYVGKAEVRAVFPVIKLGKIAGCYVTDGKILRSAKVKVKRGTEILFSGQLASLKRFKDDVKEVTSGYECGIGVEGFNDIQEGDIIECFEVKHVAAKLGEALRPEAKKPAGEGAPVAGA